MKIYAEQVAPEYQESPLFYGDWPENVYIYGNRDYKTSDKIEDLKNLIYDAADELKQLIRGAYGYFTEEYTLNDILKYFLPRDDGREYSRAERLKWRELLLSFDYYSDIDGDEITAALELITGEKYSAAEIRGCCQCEWTNILYPASYGREWLRDFEIEYFNMGDEWRISENSPDDDEIYYFYTHAWSDDGKRAEIAAAFGVDPADVVLYEFDEWTRTPNYREVGA